jgi:hypothetical protein
MLARLLSVITDAYICVMAMMLGRHDRLVSNDGGLTKVPASLRQSAEHHYLPQSAEHHQQHCITGIWINKEASMNTII